MAQYVIRKKGTECFVPKTKIGQKASCTELVTWPNAPRVYPTLAAAKISLRNWVAGNISDMEIVGVTFNFAYEATVDGADLSS